MMRLEENSGLVRLQIKLVLQSRFPRLEFLPTLLQQLASLLQLLSCKSLLNLTKGMSLLQLEQHLSGAQKRVDIQFTRF